MLDVFRNSAKGTAGKVVVGLIVLTFVLFGAQSIVSIASNTAPATVNGDDISTIEYQRLLSTRQQELANQYGAELAAQLANSDFLRNDVIENLIRQKLQTQLASDLKMAISDDQALKTLADITSFQVDGKFDKDLYKSVLATNGFTHQTYLAAQKAQLALTQMQSGIAGSAFIIDQIADRYEALDAQVRSVQFKQFNADDFRSAVELSDEDVNDYYTENQTQYMSNERIRVKYVLITLNDLAEDQTVTDEEVQAAYDSYLAEQKDQESREISHILFADGENEAEANAALERLEAGESFADLASELSDDPGSAEFGGSLGVLIPGVYVPEFYDAAMALQKAGDVSGLVKTQYGIHLIRLDALETVEPDSLEDKREELIAQLKQQKAQQEILLVETQLADMAYSADNIAAVAESFAVEVQESDWFDRSNGIGYFGEADVVAAAFSESVINEDRISDVVRLDDGSLIAVQKLDYQPEDIQPLDAVIEPVKEALTAQKASELMSEALEAELTAKNTESEGWSEVTDIKRTDTSVPTVVRNKAFELPKPAAGEKSIASTEVDGMAYLVAVSGVSEAPPEEEQADSSSIAFMEQTSGAYQYQMLYNIVRKAADVTIKN